VRRIAALVASLLFAMVLSPYQSVAHAQPVEPPSPTVRCTMTDPRLAALSGFTADRKHWYAVNAGGDKSIVYVLGKDCAVQREIVGATDPFDVQDLGRTRDGTLLLGDGGDRHLVRTTAALIALTPQGASTLYRLSYPDGRHQSAALLVGANGTPYFVTKSRSGTAGVYAPGAPLKSPGPTPMKKVASITLTPTDTPGGPLPTRVGSVTITGGAVGRNGTVVALRTYTDVYLYPAPDRNIEKALTGTPLRVPLPNEAQGEAIAFDTNGGLLSAPGRTDQPIRAIPGATELIIEQATRAQAAQRQAAQQKAPQTAQPRPPTPLGSGTTSQNIPIVPAAGIVILLIMAILGALRWRTTRSRRVFYRTGR
jgi:hypothetical protein